VLLFGAGYALVGVTFAKFSELASGADMRVLSRQAAWLVCGAGFAAHIGFGVFRLGNQPRATAFEASMAAALGAFGLAVAANLHEWSTSPHYRASIALALFVWPLLTAVPAFVAALIAAWMLHRRRGSA
jgi:hypothetical protein